jgi:GNAT superfamily N-acetyltransferase
VRGDTAFLSVDIRPLAASDLSRIGEIDRTERIAAKYEVVRSADGLSLSLVPRVYEPPEVFPRWDDEGIARRRDWWQRGLAGGGAAFGAFVGERFVGFSVALLRSHQTAEMAALFVDAEFRGRGIGSRLLMAVEEYATGSGATRMYLHPNPTVATVEFYRKCGYVLTCLVDEAIVNHPDLETCIVLAKQLRSSGE